MTKDIWFISDTHFGHEACCTKFLRNDGTFLRPFANAEEMNEVMVERWNARVKPQDKVYHLGDVVINKKFLPVMGRLNGAKKLIRGNHDIMKDSQYREYFSAIYGVRVYVDQFILSHIPLHPDCVGDRFKVNVHGHLHANRILRFVGGGNGTAPPEFAEDSVFTHDGRYVSDYTVDSRYFSVCVEQIDYAPIHMDEMMQRIAAEREQYPTW